MVSRKGRLVTKPITIEPKNTCPSFCDINFLFSFACRLIDRSLAGAVPLPLEEGARPRGGDEHELDDLRPQRGERGGDEKENDGQDEARRQQEEPFLSHKLRSASRKYRVFTSDFLAVPKTT